MKPGTRSWKQVTAEVQALLSELDPYRLDPGTPDGAPADEYAPEADAIARTCFCASMCRTARRRSQ